MFLFIVQQVHTQPLVTTTSNTTSIPTSTPKEMATTLRLSLSSTTLLICDDASVSILNVGMLEVGTSDGLIGQSVFSVGGPVVVGGPIVVGRPVVVGGSVVVGRPVVIRGPVVVGGPIVVGQSIMVLGQYWHSLIKSSGGSSCICVKVRHV